MLFVACSSNAFGFCSRNECPSSAKPVDHAVADADLGGAGASRSYVAKYDELKVLVLDNLIRSHIGPLTRLHLSEDDVVSTKTLKDTISEKFNLRKEVGPETKEDRMSTIRRPAL